MTATQSPAVLEALRKALHAYDHAELGELNATADRLNAAGVNAGYRHGEGVGLVTWSRQQVAVQLVAAGDAADLSDGEFEDILASLQAKGLIAPDASGVIAVTDKGQTVLQRLKPAEGER